MLPPSDEPVRTDDPTGSVPAEPPSDDTGSTDIATAAPATDDGAPDVTEAVAPPTDHPLDAGEVPTGVAATASPDAVETTDAVDADAVDGHSDVPLADVEVGESEAPDDAPLAEVEVAESRHPTMSRRPA